jgi:alcohol dehydrogenase class IV
MRFEFATASQIRFGAGTIQEVGDLVSQLGTTALLLTGATGQHAPLVQAQLDQRNISWTVLRVAGEPTVAMVEEAVIMARQAAVEFIISIGGGSVIDTGKAVAALLANPGEPLDYLEGIGRGKKLAKPSLSHIAIPTTAGAGAEVTRNAVLASPAHQIKVSLRSPYMLPTCALVDPELTRTLPPAITAATGADALTQCIEPYLSNQANPITDAIAREGIRRAARGLPLAYTDGVNLDARTDMAIASLCGGLALANAKLGAVHGFAGVIGGLYNAGHGAICAALLPHCMEANLQAMTSRAPDSPIVQRFQDIAQRLTGYTDATDTDGIDWLFTLARQLNLSTLQQLGVQRSDFPKIVAQAQKSSSMQGNPIVLTEHELTGILENAY